MKNLQKLLFVFVLLLAIKTNAQVTTSANPVDQSGFMMSIRAGYDIVPMYKNNTPYIDYKGGLELGMSADYYWSWFGMGFDFDYIKNKPLSTYPIDNLFIGGTQLTSFVLDEQPITRMFYGIGPDFRYVSGKFQAELNTRVGMGKIKGGRTFLQETTTGSPGLGLNFHAGYDAHVLSAKSQLRFTYFFNDNFGAHFGAYYINHFSVPELEEFGGTSAGYRGFTEVNDVDIHFNQIDQGDGFHRKPCENNISSIGLFTGITYRPKAKVKKECEVCCQSYALAVTAKDKFTGELLPNTDVAIKNIKGEVVQTGTTNSFGVVVFDPIEPDTYSINGLLYEVALDENTTSKKEFVKNETLQKEILYSDTNFILKGNSVICNSNTPLNGVSVVLKNKAQGIQKNTMTDSSGTFIFHVKQKANYEIYGKKDKFFSQTENITTKDYDRNITLFIKLEICMEKADCGTAIRLNNIHYDLDKYFIRASAKPELNRLVQFMVDNPSVHVEVSSHTDSRGSDTYNDTLSQNRANAAVDYVVSQGIDRVRLSGVGYGESILLNHCSDNVNCSKAEHQINRRTEMKVVCP
ncbi:MAG TPA: OmpA family protein [Lutibacter sp.]|nr:OmpA family protein [Lutibacter sp.]